MRSYNDHRKSDSESSESEVSDNQNGFQATTSYGKIGKITPQEREQKYQAYSESDQSSLEEDDPSDISQHQLKVEQIKLKGKDVLIRYQRSSSSQEEQEEDSIDHIEERIKRLEKDLKKRIDKHKKDSTEKKNDPPSIEKQKQNVQKAVSSPPLPKKIETKPIIHEGSKDKISPQHQQNRNKMNIISSNEQPGNTQKANVKSKLHYIEQNEVKGSPKKKSKGKKQADDPVITYTKNPITIVEKKKAESKNSQSQIKSNKQMQQMQKMIQELKSENKKLRDQVYLYKKKKPLEELQKLRELSGPSNEAKLDKEIQLLYDISQNRKVIESLQNKLKKSIQKKLTKNSRVGGTSAALLHKGLPSSLLN